MCDRSAKLQARRQLKRLAMRKRLLRWIRSQRPWLKYQNDARFSRRA